MKNQDGSGQIRSGADSLERILEQGALSVEEALALATRLAVALGDGHRDRGLRRPLTPSRVIRDAATGELQVRPTAASAGEERGALAYFSPELTGRMNRRVDHRTEFYALGVMLYRMLTGRLPFETEDPMALIHCHIARTPVPPHELRSEVPAAVSGIVMKLLAKLPEDRYQSVRGLTADLERCRREWREARRDSSFPLGAEDVSEQLRIPEKLFGREGELSRLLAAFERTSQGSTELLLIGGYSGVGKTALVHEIHTPVTEKQAFFAEGKFDQNQRGVPYSAWIQAFNGLINRLLALSPDALARWKEAILEAVGANGGVLTELIPNLELVVGEQPPVPELGAEEAQNRFNFVLRCFTRIFARAEHPLVVFLDDMQWIDSASLQLLGGLLTDPASSHLLLLGAYRDNEVDTSHPLVRATEALKAQKLKIESLALKNLSRSDVGELVSTALGCPPSQCDPLVRLIYPKTSGNAFFTHQTLHSLVERGLLALDPQSRRWSWNEATLASLDISDNVIELMVRKLEHLPGEAREILMLAACVGNTFDLPTLAVIGERSLEESRAVLQIPIEEGLVVPVVGDSSELHESFRFLHDQVQQAAYSVIPADKVGPLHVRIGNLLLAGTPEEHLEQGVFDIADHLNRGLALIADQDKRTQLARLNLLAGKKARSAAAFSASFRYLIAGIKALGAEGWESAYELALELHSAAIAAASLTENFEHMDRLFEAVERKARSAFEKVEAYRGRMQGRLAQGDIQSALDLGLEILEALGDGLPAHPTEEDTQRMLAEARAGYEGKELKELLELPKMTDPLKKAEMLILAQMIAPAYNSRPRLFQAVTLAAIRISIRYGNAPQTPYMYSTYALHLCGVVGDPVMGFRFGELALGLLERLEAREYESKVLEVVYAAVWHFKKHLRESIEPLVAGVKAGLETGDFNYVGYNALFVCSNGLYAGLELEKLEREMAKYDAQTRGIAETARRMIVSFWQAALNLLGCAECPRLLIGKAMDVRELVPVLEKTNNQSALGFMYVNALLVSYLFGDLEGARENARRAGENAAAFTATFTEAVFNFYESLTLLAGYGSTPVPERPRLLERVAANQARMALWSEHAPMNHLHKWHLVEAEKARVLGETGAARESYDRAIATARQHGFVNEKALAYEVAARFYLEQGVDDIARLYMAKAHGCYARWQAWGKVKDLEERYPHWLSPALTAEGNAASGMTTWDLSTVMKASQLIAGEIKLDPLLTRMLWILIENAGAQKGFLLLEREGSWELQAKADVGGAVGEQGAEVPMGIVNFVVRTQEAVILDDAAIEGPFVDDPGVRARKPKSVLCLPLLHQKRLRGIIYLENNLASHVFSRDRIQLLQLLAAQAAISLENAFLYEAVEAAGRVKLAHERQTAAARNLESLGAFAGSIAHDFRSILGLILGNTSLLHESASDGEKARRFAGLITTAAQRGVALVNRILTFGEQGAPRFQPIEINGFLRELVSELKQSFPDNIAFELELALANPQALADADQLGQVVLNLCTNARDAMPSGGKILIRTGELPGRKLRSRWPLAQDVSYVRLRFEDNGSGIDPEIRERIFEPFVTTKDASQGSGLGLSIVHGAIMRHGGHIEVESEQGKGTAFELFLPNRA